MIVSTLDFNHIRLFRVITVATATGMIENFAGPCAQQENKKSPAQCAKGFGHCHRVKHATFPSRGDLPGIYPLPLIKRKV